jgi:probable F420-dependent oxidoreductase
MPAVVPEGRVVWGLQLPVQSQSTRYVEPWEVGAGPEAVAAVARAADRSGAFYVAVCDHVAIPDDLVEAMGAEWWDTVATLAWLAAQTTGVRLVSHVAVPAYRHPLVTAKAWSTLDRLSGGRAVLGVGAGHVQGEFEALGLPFAERGRLLDEALDVIRAAFVDQVPVAAGGRWPVGGLHVAPRPAQPGGPPIWVGGSSPAALRRVVARGDGWLPQGPPEGGMRAAVARLREAAARERPGDRLDLGGMAAPVHLGARSEVEASGWDVGEHTVVGGPEEVAASVARLAAVGVDHVQVRFRSRSADELVEQVERFGTEVWPLVEEAHRAGQAP